MSEELVIKHCSPTLAGLKTANMFSCEYESEEELVQYLRKINLKITRKGVRAIPLSSDDHRALIYLFRPDALKKDLTDEQAEKILANAGYRNEKHEDRLWGGERKEHNKLNKKSASRNNSDCKTSCFCKEPCSGMNGCLMHLVDRLKQASGKKEFPHEIGLFLGYPPEDVKGFIEGDNSNCKCVGTWKVFGDEKSARRTFARFRKCSRIYSKLYEEGCPLEKLTIGARKKGINRNCRVHRLPGDSRSFDS